MDNLASLSLAQQFVSSVELGDLPTYSRKHLIEGPPAFVPDASKNQSIVVAAQLQSFASGIEASTRKAIMNSVLLAQLAAQNATKSSPSDLVAWYKHYYDTLGNLGWLIERKDFTQFTGGSATADVHEAVLDLAALLMGGTAVTAYLIIKNTLDAVKKLKTDTPLITVFDRQTKAEHAASFQVSVAEQEMAGEITVPLLAFRLNASITDTTVLFFKFKEHEVHLECFSGKAKVNKSVLDGIANELERKVAKYVEGYVKTIELPPLPGN